MLKLRSISKLEFDYYVEEQKTTSHFMHSSAWGEFEKITTHTTPHYLGLVDDKNNIIAATLILENHLPMNCSCLYAPRGFVLDYKNKEILEEFSNQIKQYAKNKKAISIRINPYIYYKNNKDINEILTTLNYKQSKDNKLLNYMYQLDLKDELKEIEKSFTEDTKSLINSLEKYDIEFSVGGKKELNEIINSLDKDEQEYYETLYEIFSNNKHTKMKIYTGKLHIIKTIKNLEKDIIRINNQISIIPIDNLDASSKQKLTNLRTSKENIMKQIEQLKVYKSEYGSFITVNTLFTIEYKNQVWLLEDINNEIVKNLNLNYVIYKELIRYYKNENFTIINQLSPIKENIERNELAQKFGGKKQELIGDYVLIVNKFMNLIQTKILPIFSKKGETSWN